MQIIEIQMKDDGEDTKTLNKYRYLFKIKRYWKLAGSLTQCTRYIQLSVSPQSVFAVPRT